MRKRGIFKSNSSRAAITASLLSIGAFAKPAIAQDADQSDAANNSGRYDTVIVTAQKREQSLQEVGITISAFGEQEIRDRGFTDIDLLAAALPNVQSTDDAGGQNHFRIRGVGLNEFQSSFDAPVGVNIDEFVLTKPFMASMGTFDMERIEVLKGPQGTVFGRNTTAGAVNYYTNKPTDELTAGFELTYGNYDRGVLDAYVSGPISDQVSARLAIRAVNQDSGEYLNLFDGQTIGGREDQFRVRGQLQWDNDQGTDVLLQAHFGVQEGELPPYDNLFQDIPGGAQAGGVTDVAAVIRNPVGRFVVNQDYFPLRDNEEQGLNLTVNHDVGDVGTITFLASYEYFLRDQREDADNTPVASVNIDWFSEIDQYTAELRFAGESNGWNYLIGGYFAHDDLVGVDTADVGTLRLGGDYNQVTTSFAFFTNHEYAITDTLNLTFGARYTNEKIDMESASFVATGVGEGRSNRVDPTTFLPGAFINDVERKDDAFNFKAGVTYIPSDNLTLYGSYSTGFRSGGFDVGFNAPLESFAPEKVNAAEIGLKSILSDGRVRFNLAGFYLTIENYQENANLPTELTPRRRNVGELETLGVEADVTVDVTERLTVVGSLGYTSAEIADSDFLIGTIPIEGNVPANTPEWSTNLYAIYTVPISSDYEADLIGSWSWTDERFLEIENQPDHLVDPYHLLDARLNFRPVDGNWSVSLWGKNLTDSIYLRYLNDVPGFGLFLPINAQRRTYGVTLNVDF